MSDFTMGFWFWMGKCFAEAVFGFCIMIGMISIIFIIWLCVALFEEWEMKWKKKNND